MNGRFLKPRSAGDVLDRIFASAPNGRTAAAVTSESADRYESPVKPGCLHWDAPPRTRGPSAEEIICPSFTDMTGVKFGRMTVIGIFADSVTNAQQWVVRCVCGHYEARRAKAIRNPANSADACVHCRHVAFLSQRESDRARGALRPDTVETSLARIGVKS